MCRAVVPQVFAAAPRTVLLVVTNWAIGAAAYRIIAAVLHDEQRVLLVTLPLHGELGLHGVSLSLPRLVGARGGGAALPIELAEQERRALQASAEAVGGVLAAVGQG